MQETTAMRRVATVAAMLLAIVAAIAWLLWTGAANPGPAASPSVADAAMARATTERQAQAATGETPRSGTATAVERTAASPPLAGLRATVFVVLEETQAPAAGATLWYLPPRTKAEHELDNRRIDEDRDPEPYLQAVGEDATTDERGCADAVLDANRVVCARLGERYGETFVGGEAAPDVPIVVELQRDVALRVEVVDDTGRPCAGLRLDMEGEAVSRRRGRESFSAWLGTTDALGSATLAHLQRIAPPPGPDVLVFSMVVKCECSSASRERAVGAGEAFGNVPVRIVVPSGGEVRVRVVDADGRPYMRSTALRAVGEETSRTPVPGLPGEWRFAPVPPGRRWVAEVHRGDTPTRVEFDGPLQASDAPVTVELRVPVRRWRLLGRLLQDGAPLVGAQVALVGDPPGDPESGRRTYRTGDRGDFIFRGWMSSEVEACEVSLLVEHPWLPKDTPIACAKVLAPGEVDLGDVAVPPLAFDRPLVLVRVHAEGREMTASSHVAMHTRDVRRPNRLRDVPARARTTERGIELWGAVPVGALVLHVGALGHVSKSVDVRLHDTVTVELERAAELWVSIVPPVVPPETLNVLLVAEGLATAQGLGPSGQRTHQLNWPFQPPGRYRIAVDVCGTVVYESELFDLVAGMNRWPADGSLRDLRNGAKVAHLAVVDADTGAPVAKPRFYTVQRLATDEGEREDAVPHRGEWLLVAPNAPDVLALAAGYEPVRVARPLRDQRVALRRMTTVRVFAAPGATETGVHIVEDAVRDALLRDVDEHPHSEHGSYGGEPSFDLQFAPGTVLEFTSAIGDVRGPLQRVVVGTTSPQEVQLR